MIIMGKLVLYDLNFVITIDNKTLLTLHSDIYVAVVHQDTSVEVIVLDRTGCVLETNTVNIKELIDIKVNQLQVVFRLYLNLQ